MYKYINRLYAWLYGLLPDKCEGADCCRKGMRGNENRMDGKILCDYCSIVELGWQSKDF